MPKDTPSRYLAYVDVLPLEPRRARRHRLRRRGSREARAAFGGNRWVQDGPYAVTNNRMELRAVLEALDGLPAGEAVDVVSDSRYVVDALSKWIHGWRRKGWKTAAGEPVLNRDLIEALDARGRELTVSYSWVRGHDGHAVNEIVDSLAQSAARGVAGPSEARVVDALRAAAVIK